MPNNIPEEIKDITLWAMEGIDIAKEKGKTIDDLCNFLRITWSMRLMFDTIMNLPKDGE